MIKVKYKITSENGVHARPATALVNTAVKFKADTYLGYNNKKIDLKSIMGVMSLGVYQGDVIEFIIDGVDEKECMNKIDETMKSLNLGIQI